MRRLRLQYGVGGNSLGGFQDLLVIGRDEAGFDRGLGPRPAFEQAALDQQQVRALAGRGQLALRDWRMLRAPRIFEGLYAVSAPYRSANPH